MRRRDTRRSRRILTIAIATALILGLPSGSLAQLRGSYPPGFAALESGSQGPPAINVFVPTYFYTTDDIRDDNGHSLGIHPRITSVLVAGAVTWVTNFKILDANLGGMIIPLPFLKNSIEGRLLDAKGQFGYSDIIVEPIQLGWHPKGADFLLGYLTVAPTGKFVIGNTDNAGLGQWGHLIQAGTTVRLDKREPFELSMLATYGIHTTKKDTDVRAGNVLTLEGGLGYAAFKKQKAKHPMPIDIGLVYYAQFKLTADQVNGDTHPIVQQLLAGTKDRVYGLGGELDYFIPKAGVVVGLHVLDEFGARNRTQGVTGLFSIAYQVASFVKKPPPDTP